MNQPGISRNNRISDEGLLRLKKQLAEGKKISKPVLDQWVKRYGDAARAILEEFNIPDKK